MATRNHIHGTMYIVGNNNERYVNLSNKAKGTEIDINIRNQTGF